MADWAAQARFGVYAPAALGWGGALDPMNDPSLLVPLSYNGVEFAGKVHRDVVGVFTRLLERLVPLIPGGLMSPGCWGFSASSVTVGGTRSFHTYGIAIDVNAPANPMYAPTRPSGLHAIPAAASGIARELGCEYGGDWSVPQDWMHFECHLAPDVARTITPDGALTPPPAATEDDDVKITITRHPGRPVRAFVLGPKGFHELITSKENPQSPEKQARAMGVLFNVPVHECDEVYAAIALPTNVGKAF